MKSAVFFVALFAGCSYVKGQDYCSDTRKYARGRYDPTCRTYDECVNNRWVVQTCPQTLAFYQSMQQCVLQGSFQCTGGTFQCPQPNGDFADPTDCTRFYKCTNSVPLRRNCDAGDVFDSRYGRCEFQDGTIPCQQNGGGNIFQCPSSSGRYADTSDSTCTGYYDCSNNQPTRRTCYSGQVFYPGFGQCVEAFSYKCGTGNNFYCPQANGDFADPTNPSQFYYCDKGYPLLRRCPQGLFFDSQLVRCVNRGGSISQCGNPQPISCSSGQNGNYTDNSDSTCRTYLQCRNYQAARVTCPSNFVYYPGLQKCVIPDSYNCANPNQFSCPQPNQDFPDQTNCRRFYYCSGYCPLRRTCPNNYVYNEQPKVKKCVDPSTYACPYPSF